MPEFETSGVRIVVHITAGQTCSCGHQLVNERLEVIGKRYLVVRAERVLVKCPGCGRLRAIDDGGEGGDMG